MKVMFAIVTTITTLLILGLATVLQFPWHFRFYSSSPSSIPDSDARFNTFHLESHSLRVKRSDICGSNKQYSGYVDNLNTNDHLFFTFFESLRITVTTDTSAKEEKGTGPLVLWLNGGPGCSSLTSAMTELGPCVVSSVHNEVETNPYSWNTKSNIVFVDQPANTGFSYGSYHVKNSKEAARDIFMFLQLFLMAFPNLANSQLHIAGESYAGHYIPAIASEILIQNNAAQFHLLNLNSLLIGNGWVDPRTQLKYYEPYGCANDSSYKPIFDDATCKKMQASSLTCQKLMNACYKYQNSVTCVPAGLYCQRTQLGPYDKTGRNDFDIRIQCYENSELCYNITNSMNAWANTPEIKQELGIDSVKGTFTTCNDRVAYRFALSSDMSISYGPKVAEALEAGVRVLIYAGDMDWTCNWYGSLAWTIELPWSGQLGYSESPDLDWYSARTGKLAGQSRIYKNLMFLKVNNAGHWVPYDQPEHAMEMFSTWIENRPFG
ncbi:Alpha/Beta hydrolase protein [Phascolomyces articulosus]|uniref:Carboxypeptidase n=1 Tax=Phascolomyces articulosus TaxID=60185 RepID=A0AAD5JL32_9FUNG|nr:Alpha/Beta hydrolase protein [Phascolomyces articulosus]